MRIGLEKIDTHEGVIVKALLDSRATGMFVDRRFAEKNRFKLDKLEKLLKVMNVDGSNNSGGNIIHEVKCNVYYKGHQERMCCYAPSSISVYLGCCYDLITQVATLALRLEDGLRVRRKGMHNRLSVRRYSVSTGAYILIVVQELGLQ